MFAKYIFLFVFPKIAISYKARKKPAIKRRFISASGVHQLKSLPNIAAPDRTGKVCHGQLSC